MWEIDDESLFNCFFIRVVFVDEVCLVKRFVFEGVFWYEFVDDMLLEFKFDKGGNVGYEG